MRTINQVPAMMNRTVIVGVALVAAALATAAGQAVALKRVAKIGEKATYGMKIDLLVQGMEVKVSFDTTHKVAKVNLDGTFVIEEEVKNQVVSVGGADQPPGPDQTSSTTYGANGQVNKIESQGGMDGEHRMANLTVLIWPEKPVEVGSKWTAKTPAIKESGTFENEYAFEVLARETLLGYDTFKISSVIKETGGAATCNSTTWVDVKTGLTVKSTGEMKNIQLMGMDMDAKFVLEMKK